MNLEKIKEKFLSDIERMKSLENAVALFHWDAQTGAPKKGADIRAKTLGVLSSEIYTIMTSDEMKSNLISLEENYEELERLSTPISLDEIRSVENKLQNYKV